MREYCRISPHFWTGDTGRKIRTLGHEAQVVALYLLSCPSSNMIGLYYLPIPTLCHEIQSPLEGASKALRSLQKLGFAFYDSGSEVVWVPEMAKYQIGEELKPNDNQIKGVLKELKSYAGSVFYASFVERYNEPYNLGLQKPLRSPLQAPPEPLRSQEQEQEQEQEIDQEQEQEELAHGPKEETRGPQAPASGAPPRAAPARQERFDPGSVPIPPQLDTAEFRAAWTLRLRERGEKGSKGKLTRTAVEAQLGKLVKLAAARGLPAAVACVEKATEGGYQGVVFERDFDPPNGSNGARLVGPEAATMKRWGTKLAPGTTEAHIREAEEWDRKAAIAAEEDRVAWERDRAERSVLHG